MDGRKSSEGSSGSLTDIRAATVFKKLTSDVGTYISKKSLYYLVIRSRSVVNLSINHNSLKGISQNLRGTPNCLTEIFY